MSPVFSLVRVQRLTSWTDKELHDGGELAKALDSMRETLKGPTIANPIKTFNSLAARWIIVFLFQCVSHSEPCSNVFEHLIPPAGWARV